MRPLVVFVIWILPCGFFKYCLWSLPWKHLSIRLVLQYWKQLVFSSVAHYYCFKAFRKALQSSIKKGFHYLLVATAPFGNPLKWSLAPIKNPFVMALVTFSKIGIISKLSHWANFKYIKNYISRTKKQKKKKEAVLQKVLIEFYKPRYNSTYMMRLSLQGSGAG
jgi:hypothetical protein